MGNTNRKVVLTEADLDYIALNNQISRSEVDKIYKDFIEKYPDGKITKKVFKSFIRDIHPSFDNDKLEKHIFRVLDKNGDGTIDFRELMMVVYILSSGSIQDQASQIFKVFDINRDGKISLKEVKKIVNDIYDLKSDEVSKKDWAEAAFAEMDVDHDGEVTKEEFIKACVNDEKITSMLLQKIFH